MAGGVSCLPFDVRFSRIRSSLPRYPRQQRSCPGRGAPVSIPREELHRQSNLGELIHTQELQVLFSGLSLRRLITYVELQLRASKLPRAGSCAWHFLVGSEPGGGSSRSSLRPRGASSSLPELKSEVSVPRRPAAGPAGPDEPWEGGLRRLVGPGLLPLAEGFLSGSWGGGQPSLRPSEVPRWARLPDPPHSRAGRLADPRSGP